MSGRAGRRLAGAALVVLLPLGATAALPPRWQRLREFQAVAEEAARVLGDRPIDAVERIDATHFLVRAGGCRVTVRLVPRPRSEPGPQAFDAAADRPACS